MLRMLTWHLGFLLILGVFFFVCYLIVLSFLPCSSLGQVGPFQSTLYIYLWSICLWLCRVACCCGDRLQLWHVDLSLRRRLSVRARASVLVALGLGTCAPGLWSAGSVVVEHGLSCSGTWIFLVQGSDLCLLCSQADSLPLEPQRSPSLYFS